MITSPRLVRVAAVLGLACLPASLLPGTASPAVAAADARNWSVARVAGGFRVTLDLDRELPVTASAPTLWVDGVNLGPATESADGRALSLVTTDPSVLDASSVTTDAVTALPGEATAPPGEATVPPGAATAPGALPADPAATGPHRVTEAVYRFGDQAVPLLNIGGIRGELAGKIYLPDRRGRKPVVIFLHGRHASCYGPGSPNPARWPCRTSPESTQQRMPIPSYLGYEAPARALASNGYAVVSVSANAVNANDNQLAADYGAQARGALVLDTLRMLQQADAGRNPVYHDAFTAADVSLAEALDGGLSRADLVGQLDLSNVGIMGHSRGGEGVVAAATLNDALPVRQQFGINAVLPLAPVDYDRISLPNVATTTILPYCDGDVENLMGQHIVDDSRHSFRDSVLRSAVLVMGANHNFFNTIWTPGGWPASTGDDWSGASGASDPVCNAAAENTGRLTPAEQVAVGTAYLAGFFRLVLGRERQFQPLFDGSPVVAPSTPFADITVAATQPAKSRIDIATFERPGPGIRTTGGATAEVCASMGGDGGVEIPQALPFCATALHQAALPHWSPALWAWNIPSSPMLHMRWSSTGGQLRVSVPPQARNVTRFDQISVKVAADESVATGTDLTVSVLDGSGRTWSSPVSALNPRAVSRLPGTISAWLRKVILQQVTIPTGTLAKKIKATDVREVRFTAGRGADGADTGGVYLSDLSLEDRAVGGRVPAQQTTVDLVPARVEEGSGPGSAQVAAVLSRPTGHVVTAYVSAFGAATARAGEAMQKVTFRPGQTCVPVSVPTFGDTVASTTASTSFKVSATNAGGAVMGDKGFGTLVVREDDGVTTGAPAPEFGVAGNACREYAASLRPGALRVAGGTVVDSGSTLPVSARGYRAGESVELRLGATSLGRVVADRAGEVSYVTQIPPGTAPGWTLLTATGAGSSYTTQAGVIVKPARA
jgi:trimeric autotransporter adhesin